MPGNRFLFDAAKKVLVPFFALVAMKVMRTRQDPDAWLETLKDHEQIVRMLQLGDPFIAERYVHRAMQNFSAVGFRLWVERSAQELER